MIRFGSGSYNVRDSEVVREAGRQMQRTLACTVYFLDGSQEDFELERHARGQELMDKVFEHLELIEKDYFCLQFIDLPPDEPDNMRWLEASKSIRKQMQYPPYVLYFRVKFYVSDPSKLAEEYTRYHFYLQLRKDLLEGRLVCPESSAALLGSYAIQSEFGDFCVEEHGDEYLDGFQFVPNQTTSLIRKITELHKLHQGQTPADAEFNFLDHAKRLEMYGVDLYQGRDSQQAPIQLGVTSYGLAVFQNHLKINTFSWAKIMKISFKRKQFFIQLKTDEKDVETIVGFNMSSTRACKLLWKSCIEHHTFFRLIAPPQSAPKSIFSLGSRYRYSGRTEYQTLEEMKRRARIERTFHRTGSKLSFARSTIGPSSREGILGSNRRLSSAMSSNGSATLGSPMGSPLVNGRGPAKDLSPSPFARNFASFMSRPLRSISQNARQDHASQDATPPRIRNGAPGVVRVNGESQRLSQSWTATTTNVALKPIPMPGWRMRKTSENNHLSNGHGPSTLNGSGTVVRTPSSSTKETTFGATVTSKVLGVLDDENLTEHSFEFPQSTPVSTNSRDNGHHHYQNGSTPGVHGLASTSGVQHIPVNGHGGSPGGARVNGVGLSMPYGTQRASVNVLHSRPTSVSQTQSFRNGTGSPKQTFLNGHSGTNGHTPTTNGISPLVHNHFGGSQRSSVASRSSLTSLQQNGGLPANGSTGSPQHLLPSRTSPKRISPPLGGGQNGVTVNGYGPPSGSDEGLVQIRIKPDSQGRFGFNVKGGADQHYPIIVSRVAAKSPADTCYPRLNEGDQVLMINGRDISQHTHDQVVRFIRSAREAHTGELLLTVRPNVYVGEDIEEPDFQYVPETPHVAECIPRSDLLHQSLLLLKDAIASGAAVHQFEQLYRKKPGLLLNCSKAPENLNKNRYRDVSPYDSTRVILQQSASGDYINASFVNMEIPSSGIVNRYIAAQGPLPHTTADFWLAVWEQLCTTIVMLTTTVERGRVKCFQYWPKLYETQDYGQLQVTCVREKETKSSAYRDFTIVNKQTKEERQLSQMQYMAWPDHGVPDDPQEFVNFVLDVRKNRAGSVEPLLVHCSAGIGRTGVLILMETAMCLVEANEPIYPLEIVRTMRDQRAMLIQTSSQYKFVCEAVLKAYNEGFSKPLAEYQHR